MPVTRSVGRQTAPRAVMGASTTDVDTSSATATTTENTEATVTTETSQPTVADAPTEELQAAAGTAPPRPTPSKAASIQKRNSKQQRLAQAKTRLIRWQMELAAAEVAEIEAEEDSDDEVNSVITGADVEPNVRVDNWLTQNQLSTRGNAPVITAASCRVPVLAPAGVSAVLPPQGNSECAKIVPTTIAVSRPPREAQVPPPVIAAASWQPRNKPVQPPPVIAAASWQHAESSTQPPPVITAWQGSKDADLGAPSHTAPPPSPKKPQPETDIGLLASAITQAMQATQLSQPLRYAELPTFGGAHEEWLTFRAAYAETAGHFSPLENMSRLRRSLKGMAKESVQGLLIANADPNAILKTLETRFGRPESIAMAEMDRLRALPKLTESPRDLCTFATRVQNVLGTLQALDCTLYMYNPEIAKGLTEKLTPTLRREWYRFSATQPTGEPALAKFSRFIMQEADFCSPFASAEIMDRPPRMETAPRRQRVHTTSENTAEPTCGLCSKKGHAISTCDKFIKADVNRRWDEAKKHQLCFRCLKRRTRQHSCKSKRCDIDGCERFHHKLLHPVKKPTEVKHDEVTTDKDELVNSAWAPRVSYLKIAPVRITGSRSTVDTYALLDDGSTVTLIDEDLAKTIGMRGPKEPLHITTYDGSSRGDTKSRRVSIKIKGTHTNQPPQNIEAHSVGALKLAAQRIPRDVIEKCGHLKGIVDHVPIEPVEPRILIGQDNWPLLLASETKTGGRNQPVASLTPLGWVVHGSRTRTLGQQVNFINYTAIDSRIEKIVEEYITADNIYIQPRRPRADPEEKALKILREKTKQLPDGRYETGLLWKMDKTTMPCNYESTLKRLHGIERKLDRDPSFKEKYARKMDELVTKGYAEPAPSTSIGNKWYLPHFAVLNNKKPGKLRVVHDAAAKTAGVALNDYLLTGPDLLQPLPGILMRFRENPIAVTADIREMFLQVRLREEDRDALRYLWRGSRRDGAPPEEFRMKTLIFGASSSPATAIYIMNKNAEKFAAEYPEAVAAIRNKHYVDDYIDSFVNNEEAIKIATQVRKIHGEAHFHLAKWASNSPQLLQALGETTSEATVKLEEVEHERVLGLIWQPPVDKLAFDLRLSGIPPQLLDNKIPTKRETLQIVMSVFDPLGMLAPLTIRPKQILQEIWRRGTAWDERIPEDLAASWHKWLARLRAASHITLPRNYPKYCGAKRTELHVFTDASEAAYAAVLYWRIIGEDDEITVVLVAAKAKVAPLKVLSIPRLELQAAVLGARMANSVKNEHQRKPDSTTFWTDSKTTLCWIRTGARSFKPYVAHRVAAIEEYSKVTEWRWVPTKFNAADDATRDTPDDFSAQHRWFHGPEFLRREPNTWPIETDPVAHISLEQRNSVTTLREEGNAVLPDVGRFSSWTRYLRATARVLQAVELFKRQRQRVNYKRNRKNMSSDPDWRNNKQPATLHRKNTSASADNIIPLPAEFQLRAETLIIKASQEDSFDAELRALKNGVSVPRDSRLYTLSVYLSEGLLRLNSRIAAATGISEATKNPPIVDGGHPATRLWIQHTHERLHHTGTEGVVNECRIQRWVLRLRPTVKQIVTRCLKCRARAARPPQPTTGNLPPCRLAHHCRPFTYTGLDYFGPISVTIGRSHQKRYVALFTCLTVRAVHLEMVHSLSTEAAVMALRRMMARRGCPAEIWSDNATNFHGADKELRHLLLKGAEQEASKKTVKWRFIPPGAPFMGGAWERLVRSVKVALSTVLHERAPKEETLTTLLAEVEYTVNSRPLTHVSVSPEDPEALTPNHFLLGGHGPVIAPGIETTHNYGTNSNLRTAQELANAFWARWLKEYLPELRNRREPHHKGAEPKVGDLVRVVDGTLPRNVWVRGQISATYPGPDGITRTVDVSTKSGVLRRPVKKIVVILPQ